MTSGLTDVREPGIGANVISSKCALDPAGGTIGREASPCRAFADRSSACMDLLPSTTMQNDCAANGSGMPIAYLCDLLNRTGARP